MVQLNGCTMNPGYYKLTHQPSGFFYVGSSQDLDKRISNHRSDLNRGTNSNKSLQQVYTNWSDMLVEKYPTATLTLARNGEQRLIDAYTNDPLFCNIGSSSNNPTAGVITTEIRQKLMATINHNQIGKPLSSFQRSRISAGKIGVPRNEETRAAISLGKSRSVTIEGIQYDSIALASVALGITTSTIRYRVGSNNHKYVNWKFL